MKQYKINGQISSTRISLIDSDGKSLGETALREAIVLAREKDLDVVEIVPQRNGSLSVCKLLDYGQFLYIQNKKEKQARKGHAKAVSEIRFGLNIAEHDLAVKTTKIIELLREKSQQVKITIRLKGRERQSGTEKAVSLLKSVYEEVQKSGIAKIEKPPIAEGASIFMVLRRE